VIGAYYHYNQNTFTNASCASLGSHSQCAGTFDAVCAVLDWQFANKFDAYVGFMFSQVNGGLSNGYLARQQYRSDCGRSLQVLDRSEDRHLHHFQSDAWRKAG
jgi:hypothetical protein